MIFINNTSVDPYFNLALEEHLLLNTTKDIFMLWQNHNTIVVGKNQNTAAEINVNYVKSERIDVVRRLTGGGAVYHDMGNINFSFITSGETCDFSRFMQPIVSVLRMLGANAQISGRNDITIDDKKVSGNSQTIIKGRILHHGTLLFDSDLSKISNALQVDHSKISGKGIKSVRSRVTNIKEHLRFDIPTGQFRSIIAKNFSYPSLEPDPAEICAAKELAELKYHTWEWNYGTSPEYTFKNSMRFESGGIEILLNVEDGIIKNARFYGDFFGNKDKIIIENALVGLKHTQDDIYAIINRINIGDFFMGISCDDFMKLVDY